MWLVLRQALMLALLGVAIGLPLAFLAGRLAKEQLIQTSQFDPLTMIAVICILPLLAVAGTCFPRGEPPESIPCLPFARNNATVMFANEMTAK